MDREVLLEIGCEEIPASWLPPLTAQIGEVFAAQLTEFRLNAGVPIETYSTPRRLALRVERVAERQADFEETLMGPPVSAAFRPDGEPTPAAAGFARKHGVDVAALGRVDTPKGTYLAYQRRHRSRAAVDVLPDVLRGTLRSLSFPRQMRWDAELNDGKGELLFGRPIRWILYLYGGRVVPFTISRTEAARSGQVQDVRSGAVTYGHRFLATSGRAGRANKVRSFDDYRAKLAENFVVLDRSERRDRILRDLDVHARRLGGRVMPVAHSTILEEVPDLVEYPAVVAGTFTPDFLDLPPEVLTTTMIHHQHFFPVIGDDEHLLPAFLAVTNTAPDNARNVARNAERVLTARLRDARFFWQADRQLPLESRLGRLDTVLFHQKLGSYRAKSDRIGALAAWIARDGFGLGDSGAANAGRAAMLAKADLTTELVREFTNLQGIMGGIYAREDGEPEQVWRAIYYHYLPIAAEPDAPPSRDDLGAAAGTWAAVSLADKLDTVVGLIGAGERPTGSRDPFGLRRQAHGILRILVDLPELTGSTRSLALDVLVAQAEAGLGGSVKPGARETVREFLLERLRYVLEQRGYTYGEVRAVTHEASLKPYEARLKLDGLKRLRGSADFEALAVLFKRVKNIARELPDERYADAERTGTPLAQVLIEPAEQALLAAVGGHQARAADMLSRGAGYGDVFSDAAALRPLVDRFFTDVFVMVDDAALREARLRLMKRLEGFILSLGDISEIVPQTT
jgi:glycyl-tRNA synthetase beta chain